MQLFIVISILVLALSGFLYYQIDPKSKQNQPKVTKRVEIGDMGPIMDSYLLPIIEVLPPKQRKPIKQHKIATQESMQDVAA